MVEATDTDLTTLMVTIHQVRPCMATGNHLVMDKVITLTDINLMLHGVLVVMVLCMVIEVLEVVKVSLLFRSFTDERS